MLRIAVDLASQEADTIRVGVAPPFREGPVPFGLAPVPLFVAADAPARWAFHRAATERPRGRRHSARPRVCHGGRGRGGQGCCCI